MDLNYSKLFVKQKVEMVEVFTGFETKNKYQILSESGGEVLFAYEESDWFTRFLLKKMRALKLHFIDREKKEHLFVEKKFAFFFPKFQVYNSEHKLLAQVTTRFGMVSKFEIFDENNQMIYYCSNKVMHPWTFEIFRNKNDKNVLGKITKEWSGLGAESFTDKDNFLVDFEKISDNNHKQIVLALALMIDLYRFESH